MASKSDPWYLHAAMYAIIVILIGLLVKVAIIDPTKVVQEEKFYRLESRERMDNLKEAEILWFNKHNQFTDNLDALINFVKNDPYVDSMVTGYDSVAKRSSNPFTKLSHGEFTPDSLYRTPKSGKLYIVKIDTSLSVDTVVNRQGKVLRLDSTVVIGSRYYIEDPDGYGTIGSLDNDALKNTSSWE